MKPNMDFSLGGLDKIFRPAGNAAENKHIVILPLAELHQHPQLAVEVRQDAYLDELTDSIRKNGLLEEIRAFPDPDGGYWIISGRHRCMAAQRAGLSEIPVILDDTMTQETAEIAITDCNLRHELGVMEKAWTYRIKREAESRQGYRTDLHPEDGNLPTIWSDHRPDGLEVDAPTESERTIQRYIRLTYLVPELQALADRQDSTALKIRTGAALSYLSASLQHDIACWIKDYGKTPDMKTAEEWKLLWEDISSDDVLLWFQQEDKPKEKSVSVSLPYSKISNVIPAGYGKKEITELVQTLLKDWAARNEVVSEDPFPDLKIGEWAEGHGALLTWGELRIGMKVLEDCSTVSHPCFRIGQVEKFTQLENGEDRIILRDSTRSHAYINRSYIDRGTTKLYRPVSEKEAVGLPEPGTESQGNGSCITGLSPSGHCGAAHYCDQPYDCCQDCPEECNVRCGWIKE